MNCMNIDWITYPDRTDDGLMEIMVGLEFPEMSKEGLCNAIVSRFSTFVHNHP